MSPRGWARAGLSRSPFAGRIGWREITLSARDGAEVTQSDVPSTSESAALRGYPKDLLRSPLDVSTAAALVELGYGPGTPPGIDAVPAAEHESGGFEALIEQGDVSLGVLLLSLLIAAFWGAAHALTPGHGKALVAAYLVGTKGTPRHAVLLGRHRDDRAHGRSVRNRARDPRSFAVHPSRAAVSLAHACLRTSRRRRRRGSAPPATPLARTATRRDQHHHEHDTRSRSCHGIRPSPSPSRR